jgi:polysaccharide export outer membrane protein
MRLLLILAGSTLLVCAGCSTPRFVGRPNLQMVQNGVLPAPTAVDVTSQNRPHLIGPLDRLAVEVFGAPELSRTIQVDTNGAISYPLLGTIQAGGKTPEQIADEIERGLRGRYVRNPQVSVNPTEIASQLITVGGSVQEPGIYPVVGRMTLLRAVARAKGVSEFANQQQVVVFRRVNNQDMVALYDMRAINQGLYEDPEVFANDVVMVGDSPGRRLFRDVIQGAGILVAPLVAILQRQ